MGTMILCRGREAKRPFRVEGTQIRIFSAEELCYYIYNNIYLISNDFVNDKLIAFLAEEVLETALAERLNSLKKKNAGLAEMIVTILKTIDYYSIGEIEEIREILNTLNNQNVYERLKSRGDSYLFSKCFFNAIKCYERIIDECKAGEISAGVYAKVWHNMGVCYARMFMYEEAHNAFMQSYKHGQFEETRKCLMAAELMLKRSEGPENDDSTEEEYVLKREIETLMDNARYSEKYRELEDIEALKTKGEVVKYNEAIDNTLSLWKNNYLNYSKL